MGKIQAVCYHHGSLVWASAHQCHRKSTLVRPSVAYRRSSLFHPNLARRKLGKWEQQSFEKPSFALLARGHRSLLLPPLCSETQLRHRSSFCFDPTPPLKSGKNTISTMADDLETSSSDEDGFQGVEESLPDNAFQESTDTEETSGSETPEELKTPPEVVMTARAYQLEMLQESLRRNIIVAMDTGSGKTQVAILRIQKELERSDKLIWFLAPTVQLTAQQFDVIEKQIPGVISKFISGADNVQAWKYKTGVWDAVLNNVRIVVSTYQILFDAAVSHAFVPLESIGLLVIDEAHNCVRMNSVARLMRESYAKLKAQGKPVPHILGLTASPAMSSLTDIETLEQTLDAICRTPSRHREELRAHVNRPIMKEFIYGNLPEPQSTCSSVSNMTKLIHALRGMDFRTDPHVLRLRAGNTEHGREALDKVLLSRDTQSQRQMKALYARAREMQNNLGPWATEYYINRVITEFLKPGSASAFLVTGHWDEEKAYLATTLRGIKADAPPSVPDSLSRKVQGLVEILASHKENPIGIVFVTERATASVLSHILSVHPSLKSRYSVEFMVGTSKLPGSKSGFLDLTQKEDLQSLEKFRKGKINLLVATSVLEEGIDVPACNLVICFDKPSNLKSFIQRRGRARMTKSELWILFENEQDQSLGVWKALEQEMKRKYEDDMRQIRDLEESDDGSEAENYPKLVDKKTGAQISIHDAKQHLEHFCSTLSTRKFVSWAPIYTIHDPEGNPIDPRKPGLRKATVTLPISLSPSLRRAESLWAWPSEAYAYRDAAFQAYKKLYEAGLVNQHMLPLRETPALSEVETREGLTKVELQYNPWPEVAKAWESSTKLYSRRVKISSDDGTHWAQLDLSLPVPVPLVRDHALHSERRSSWLIETGKDPEREYAKDDRDHGHTLLKMAFGHRFTVDDKQYPIRFFSPEQEITTDHIASQTFDSESLVNSTQSFLIRDTESADHPFFYMDWLPTKPPINLVKKASKDFQELPEDAPYIVAQAFPKKAGQFRRTPDALVQPLPSGKPYPRVILARQVKVDKVPTVFAHVGLMIPALTAVVGDYLIARDLLEGSLQTTGITDLNLVVTAITASGARRSTDYERIEFLGDSMLKFCTTINCSAQYLHYPEGFLSASKDKIVSNNRLCKAAKDFGLGRYIINNSYTTDKWRPVFVEDYLERANDPSSADKEPKFRVMATKTLADVVEALIGTSHISGGITKALSCISLFLPEAKWKSIDHCRQILYDEAPDNETLPVTMHRLEELIGYTFTKKSLLIEAMTHPSYNVQETRASLDRLEFLGDAILDHLVVEALFALTDPLTGLPLENSRLHLLRTALVNADILGFLVMEWAVEEERTDAEVVMPESMGNNPYARRTSSSSTTPPPEINLTSVKTRFPLWSFMRYSSPDMGEQIVATSARHAALREEVLDGLWKAGRYPWAALTRLQAHKFYSDVFESLVGAVWVDSGSLEECKGLLERIGIVGVLERLIREGVWCFHPKEELGLLAAGKKVEYRVEEMVVGEDGDGERGYECEVVFSETGEVVARVRGGRTKEETRVRGAEAAVGVLRARREKAMEEKRRVLLEGLGRDVEVDA